MGRSQSRARPTVSEAPGVAVRKCAPRSYCGKIDGRIDNRRQGQESEACRKWEWADCAEDVRDGQGVSAIHQRPQVPVVLQHAEGAELVIARSRRKAFLDHATILYVWRRVVLIPPEVEESAILRISEKG